MFEKPGSNTTVISTLTSLAASQYLAAMRDHRHVAADASLDVRQVAERLGVAVITARRMIAAGEITTPPVSKTIFPLTAASSSR